MNEEEFIVKRRAHVIDCIKGITLCDLPNLWGSIEKSYRILSKYPVRKGKVSGTWKFISTIGINAHGLVKLKREGRENLIHKYTYDYKEYVTPQAERNQSITYA